MKAIKLLFKRGWSWSLDQYNDKKFLSWLAIALQIILPITSGYFLALDEFEKSCKVFYNEVVKSGFPFYLELNDTIPIILALVLMLLILNIFLDSAKERKIRRNKVDVHKQVTGHVDYAIKKINKKIEENISDIRTANEGIKDQWHQDATDLNQQFKIATDQVNVINETLRESTERINAAIHYAPNPKVFKEATNTYNNVQKLVSKHKAAKGFLSNADETIKHYQVLFSSFL
jgi:hypothetical protein